MDDSGLLESTTDSAPLALGDVVSRNPYEPTHEDGATLKMIYAIDRTEELKELSKLSRVVAALKKYETYRIYFREEDDATKAKLETMIGDCCHV